MNKNKSMHIIKNKNKNTYIQNLYIDKKLNYQMKPLKIIKYNDINNDNNIKMFEIKFSH